jgi:nitrite reductase/ring-hydroxylating ferredoxin subunit
MASELQTSGNDRSNHGGDPSIRRCEDNRSIIVSCGETTIVAPRWCPHRGGDLAAGRVVGNALQCPLHGYLFSLETGLGLNNPLRLQIEARRGDQ